MSRLAAIALLLGALLGPAGQAQAACAPLLDHSFAGLADGRPQSLCRYQGQVVLVVNTASYCGYTPQYQGLEALYQKYRGRGLVVLGFPSNDFGAQEPGSNAQIADFCSLTYGVKFPMFAKSSVSGEAANPLHAMLARLTGQPPRWNFHKYLIDRSGTRVQPFASHVAPNSRELVAAVERLLQRN